jgi:Fe-S-cluster containining protein
VADSHVDVALEADAAALSFRCTSCGECCRALRVAVTSFDVARLVAATGRSAAELVAWLAPGEVDMTGEPQSFVELREGRRLMVLAQASGACRLLGTDHRCSVYPARPRDCRAFPFDFSKVAAHGATVRRLTLLPLQGCDFASDGQQSLAELASEDAARWHELERYQELVARWNRQVWHRRRLNKAIGTAAEFLRQTLAP